MGARGRPFWEPWAANAPHCHPNAPPTLIFEGIFVDLSGGCLFGRCRGALWPGPTCDRPTQAQSKRSFRKTHFGTKRVNFGVTLGSFWEALGHIWPPWGGTWSFFPHWWCCVGALAVRWDFGRRLFRHFGVFLSIFRASVRQWGAHHPSQPVKSRFWSFVFR